jgi:hypothetical protein
VNGAPPQPLRPSLAEIRHVLARLFIPAASSIDHVLARSLFCRIHPSGHAKRGLYPVFRVIPWF